MAFLRRLAFAPVVLVVVAAVTYGTPRILRPDAEPRWVQPWTTPWTGSACALALWAAVLLIVLGLIADVIVSRLDPRVRLSHGRAW